MKQMKTKAKATITRIVKVPQKIGHSVLTVQDKLKKKRGEKKDEEYPDWYYAERDEATYKSKISHAKVCSDIIEDQHARSSVTESRDECIREITDHLKLFLFEKSNSNSERYEYEEWIMALHPENVDFIGSGRSLIDHRFYMKDSHHRELWNECMIKMNCKESIVPEESRSNKNKSRTLVDVLVEEPEELFSAIDQTCCFTREP